MVQVIKASRVSAAARTVPGALRVAAYARVSTDSEEQETSYEAQCRHYTDYIASQPNWTLAGIYADEGISGTSTRGRAQFNRMIQDCERGEIDFVITKSISRWARNTIDSLQNIRKLKALGIPVLFEKEAINTMDARGEVLITIMSSIAQQESESISKNVRMGIQYQMQQGRGHFNTSRFLGYARGQAGRLVIEGQEAELVRRIYRMYLEGMSPAAIAGALTAEGLPPPGAKGVQSTDVQHGWYPSTISSILKNEKYAGDLLMQKYFVADVLTHKSVKNQGQLPQYFVENAHEPIVPREIYNQVQGEMRRRAALKLDPNQFRKRRGEGLSGKLICGVCGRALKRYTCVQTQAASWRCRQRNACLRSPVGLEGENRGGCSCRNVLEIEALAAIRRAFQLLPERREALERWRTELRETMRRLDDDLARLGASPAPEAREKQELRRAEVANAETQLRFLLELIDEMGERGSEREISAAHEGCSDACAETEDFFRRTRHPRTQGGQIDALNADLMAFVERVQVTEDGYAVDFRGGETISVADRA